MADTVASLLAVSRAAHAKYKQAANRRDGSGKHTPDYKEAEAQVAEALNTRISAQALDPGFTDGAWLADRGKHADLVSFYRRYPLIP